MKWYVLMIDEKGNKLWVETADPDIYGKPGTVKVHNKKLCSIVAVIPA
jgi:hypothetical protein